MSGIKIVSQIFKILFQSVVMQANALKWNFRSSLFLKKRLWHRCFPVNFVKISKNTFLHRTPLVAASKIFQLSSEISEVFMSNNFEKVSENNFKKWDTFCISKNGNFKEKVWHIYVEISSFQLKWFFRGGKLIFLKIIMKR